MTKNEYLELVKQAKHNADLYYNEDAPEISDYEYDALTRKIKAAEKYETQGCIQNTTVQ